MDTVDVIVGVMRTAAAAAVVVVVVALTVSGCASAEPTTQTEADGVELARAFAATDLVLGVEAVASAASVVVSGTITNAGPSDSGDVHVRLAVGPGLGVPAPLVANCETIENVETIDEIVVECRVTGSLPVTMPPPNQTEEQTARFELVLPVDRQTLASDGNVVISAVVSAADLDLENDPDPTNNLQAITVAVPSE